MVFSWNPATCKCRGSNGKPIHLSHPLYGLGLVAARVIFVVRRCGLEAQPHFGQTSTTDDALAQALPLPPICCNDRDCAAGATKYVPAHVGRAYIVPLGKLELERAMGIENTAPGALVFLNSGVTRLAKQRV